MASSCSGKALPCRSRRSRTTIRTAWAASRSAARCRRRSYPATALRSCSTDTRLRTETCTSPPTIAPPLTSPRSSGSSFGRPSSDMPGHWLLKSEPSAYSFDRLVADGKTRWDGVRNFTARNHLREMAEGDTCFFYHSGEGKEVVGVARVTRSAFPDPTAPDEDWSAVEIAPVKPFPRPVTLAEMKADKDLTELP